VDLPVKRRRTQIGYGFAVPARAARRRTRLALIGGLVAATTLAAAAPADARSFVLRATGSQTGLGEVRAIGDFKPAVNPRLRAAVRAFGQPTSRRGGGEICRVRWNRFGLTIRFQNFGGFNSCGPRGLAQKAVVTGEQPWRTAKGLRLGDGVVRIRRLYPNARQTRRGFRIISGILPFGRPQPYAVLGARLEDGDVSAFTLFIGAAGD
jgi:hypothetical protein